MHQRKKYKIKTIIFFALKTLNGWMQYPVGMSFNPDTARNEMQSFFEVALLGNRDPNSFVPGIEDLIYGNESKGIEPMQNRIDRGKIAIQALKDYKLAKENNDTIAMANHKSILETHFKDFGYGYLEKPSDTIPLVALTFYSFHIMVTLGSFFFLLFIVTLYLTMANDIEKFRKVLWVCSLSIQKRF